VTPNARRELELRLKVVTDSSAAVAGLNNLAAAAGRVEMAGMRASAALGGSPAPGGGAGGPSFASYALGGIMAYAGQQGVAKAGQIGATFNDSFATEEQQGRAVFRALPGGETLQGAIDSLSGRKDLFARVELQHQQEIARMSGASQAAAYSSSARVRQAGLDARASYGGDPLLEGRSDRSTGAGERAFQERQKLLAIDREGVKAARETAAATAQRLQAEKEMVKIDERMKVLHGARANTIREGGRLEGAEAFSAVGAVGRYTTEITALHEQAKQVAQQLAAAKEAEARGRHGEGSVASARFAARAGILEERAAYSSSIAQRLGGMDRFSRADAVESLEFLMKYGPDMLTQEQIAQAQSVAPAKVARILEKHGAATSAAGRLAAIDSDFSTNPEALRDLAGRNRDAAAETRAEIDAAFATGAAEAGKELAETVVKAMRQVAKEAVFQIYNEMIRAKGAGG
jgi:hypothetical protein